MRIWIKLFFEIQIIWKIWIFKLIVWIKLHVHANNLKLALYRGICNILSCFLFDYDYMYCCTKELAFKGLTKSSGTGSFQTLWYACLISVCRFYVANKIYNNQSVVVSSVFYQKSGFSHATHGRMNRNGLPVEFWKRITFDTWQVSRHS